MHSSRLTLLNVSVFYLRPNSFMLRDILHGEILFFRPIAGLFKPNLCFFCPVFFF